jgi:ferredoxin
MKTMDRAALGRLFDVLKRRGFTLVGPTVRDQAIVYDEIDSPNDLPIGYDDEQDGGRYRLRKRNDDAFFAYVVGPHSWKKLLFPPAKRLWTATRSNGGYDVAPEVEHPPLYAFIGVRSCELHAIAIQDRVFLEGKFVDPAYKARRDHVFTVAVNCGRAGGTCFCTSMNTGPKASGGYDLALTEVIKGDRHYFVVDIGTEHGQEVMAEVPCVAANELEREAADEATENAVSQMKRSMDTVGLKELLYRNYENPRWEDVAKRCLTCGNCTMVCPTCFCTTVEDTTDLTGDVAERWRRWDSCFTGDFSFIHGGNIRQSAKSRYRQWMTHKLATWLDQFGSSGCVGCGRCITWCPVGIDITEEVRAIRESEQQSAPATSKAK